MLRYYNLVSHSYDEISSLETELKRHLMGEGDLTQSGLMPDDFGFGFPGGGFSFQTDDTDDLDDFLMNQKPVNPSIINIPVQEEKKIVTPEIFDIVYNQATVISKGKVKLFENNVPPTISIDLVVNTNPAIIKRFQEYLTSSTLEVKQAEYVTDATLSFQTNNGPIGDKRTYHDLLKQYADRYSSLNVSMKINSGFLYFAEPGGNVVGLIDGPIKEVLQFKQLLTKEGMGTTLKTQAMMFYNKQEKPKIN